MCTFCLFLQGFNSHCVWGFSRWQAGCSQKLCEGQNPAQHCMRIMSLLVMLNFPQKNRNIALFCSSLCSILTLCPKVPRMHTLYTRSSLRTWLQSYDQLMLTMWWSASSWNIPGSSLRFWLRAWLSTSLILTGSR